MSTESVTELCEQGLSAETAGALEQARMLYVRAWENADEAFDRSVAAHYRTRIVENAEERLSWARVSVESAAQATVIDDERIYPLLPTLHVTAAAARYEMGDRDAARESYLAAASALRVLGDAAPQAALLNSVIFEGLRAAGYSMPGSCREVESFIALLHSDGAMGPLAYVLSSYVTGCGTDDHPAEFISALRALYDARVLADDQQQSLRSAIESAETSAPGRSRSASGGMASSSERSPSPTVARHSDPFGDDSPKVALRI
ncbi:hypothetical protein ACWDTI_17620 [Gordonia sp. NPDC003424]